MPLLKRPVSVMFAFILYFISTNRSAAGSNFSVFFFVGVCVVKNVRLLTTVLFEIPMETRLDVSLERLHEVNNPKIAPLKRSR